jgi:hypothetical protein
MECKALVTSESLARLIAELDGTDCNQWRDAAFVCLSPSREEPGRKRLWVIPLGIQPGTNVGVWIKDHQELFNELVNQSVANTTVVFPGDWPKKVERHPIDITSTEVGTKEKSRRRSIRRTIRATSATGHIWIDRMRIHTNDGELDDENRRQKLNTWAGKQWKKEDEDIYIQANLLPADSQEENTQDIKDGLLAAKPEIPSGKFIVVYGQGGAGKTFFLSRLAHQLSRSALQDVGACIPVFVQLRGILHKYALENWLARTGFGTFTLSQLTILLKHGVIVPILDALDEVVKGEARIGSDEFLDHVFGQAKSGGTASGVLACRDYYLTAERAVVHDRASRANFPQLLIGLFDQQDTRRYLQVRTGLPPEHASRWAYALEREAREIVGGEAELDVIRHPVVLATLAQHITNLPDNSRVLAADDFHLTRTDIFGNIVDELLKRERLKHAPLWEEAFAGRLTSEWMDPFSPEKQRTVLRELTLIVARDGGNPPNIDEDGRGELRHGIFRSTKDVPQGKDRRDVLEKLMPRVAGHPQAATTISEEEKGDVESEARKHLAEAYAAHILANTEPDLPDDLVFALRHRFYFDYFVADALIEQLELALSAKSGEGFVNWCMTHHVSDAFATSLDFLSWDTRVTRSGVERLNSYFAEQGVDPVLSSYLCSLALSIFLRHGYSQNERQAGYLQFAKTLDSEILLVKEFLPKELSDFGIVSSSFPTLILDGVDLRNVEIVSSDFQSFQISGNPSKITNCVFSDVDCKELRLSGNVIFTGTVLDIDGAVVILPTTRVEMYNCTVAAALQKQLQSAQSAGTDIRMNNVTVLEVPSEPSPTRMSRTVGRRFVNKLMTLLRKEGHSDFAVLQDKLRTKTPGTDSQFAEAVRILIDRGCIERSGAMLVMSEVGASHMYRPQFMGRPGYDAHESYWDPIVRELDGVLGG